MAFFHANGNKPLLIPAGSNVTGQFETDRKLLVEGLFAGSIRSTNDILVGKSGCLQGTVIANRLTVGGHFHGNAQCHELIILNGGRVTGQVRSASLVMERGGYFEGERTQVLSTPRKAFTFRWPWGASEKPATQPPLEKLPQGLVVA